MRHFCVILFSCVLLFAMQGAAFGQTPDSILAIDSSAFIWQQEVEPPLFGPEIYTGTAPVVLRSEVSDDKIFPRSNKRQPVWVFAIFVLQILVFTIVKVFYSKNLDNQFNAATSLNLIEQLRREQETSPPMSSVLLNYNAVVSIGLFGYLAFSILKPDFGPQGFVLFLILIIANMALTFAKYLQIELTAMAFPYKEELGLYSFNLFLGYKLLGVALLPLNLFLAYMPFVLGLKIVLALCFFSLLIFVIQVVVRGWLIGRNCWANNNFHFILYICTLEILPMAVIIKLASNFIQ